MNTLDIIGALTGILGVYLTQRRLIWCFPIGILSVIISFIIFLELKLYADAIQQVFYFVLLMVGWINWTRDLKTNKTIHISITTLREAILLTSCSILVTLILGYILSRYTDAVFPWIDSSATSLAFTAQWMIAKRKLENWYLWMIVNITYIAIYINKDLWAYIILYCAYLVLSFTGLRAWKKEFYESINN
jgi:nicotinamide mononucleotide transporter